MVGVRMKSIGTRFSIVVGAFAIAFSALILYRAWSSTRDHMEELTALQAELALEFDLAIREYAAESIRPEMAKRIGEDEFVVEAMSTSYIARRVFEKVHEEFPEYVIKFSVRQSTQPEESRRTGGIEAPGVLPRKPSGDTVDRQDPDERKRVPGIRERHAH